MSLYAQSFFYLLFNESLVLIVKFYLILIVGESVNNKDQKIIELATLSGRILLESEAEGYRVERTVRQILDSSGMDNTDVFSNATGLFLSLNDSDDDTQGTTRVIRVNQRANHIRKIHEVNDVTYRYLDGDLAVDAALNKLLTIRDNEYDAHNNFLATIILVISFVILLGGSAADVLISLISSITILFFDLTQDNFGLNNFSVSVLTTTIIAFLLHMVQVYVTQNFSIDIVIGATLMPLYPGTAFTNAIRDLLKGDHSSGMARMLDASMKALSLALGIGIGLSLAYGVVNLWM